ncbi:MAG: acyltransferase [Acidobacteria bacterium]|nr:acyltransferase [Acidobacteriota bacterium]
MLAKFEVSRSAAATKVQASGINASIDVEPARNSHYRPDVDGLRAIAILPVVFYHAGFSSFSGGFVGVDVFFVISGYLITSLILPEVVSGKFSITNFYERRIRRIFPALFTIMFVSLAVSSLLMWPLAFKDFGHSLFATTIFASNFLFWNQFGYFDASAESRPLLHTWSLAVEEQFYIVFPIYLFIVARWFSRALKPLTATIAILSFGFSLYGVAYAPSAAFYLPPSRTWELLLGVMLAMKMFPPLKSPILRNWLTIGGLMLIALAIGLLTRHSSFPGVSALLPCVGTFLVIYAGTGQPTAVSRLLSKRWLVFIGLISYSLYLWHWPLIVFAELYLMRVINKTEAWVIIALSFALAALSWKFIENPFRTRRVASSRRKLFAMAGAVMAMALFFGWALEYTKGLPRRMTTQARKFANISYDCHDRQVKCSVLKPEEVQFDRLCRLGASESAKPDFALWGDSHGEFVVDTVAQAAIAAQRSGLQITSEGCPPMLGVTRPDRNYRHCPAFTDAAFKVIADPQIRQVIIVARWALWSEGSRFHFENGGSVIINDAEAPTSQTANRDVLRRGLTRTLDSLKALGKKVTIVAPIPEIGWDVPTVLALESWHNRNIHSEPTRTEFEERTHFAIQLLQELQTAYGFDLIYPHQTLCDQKTCRAVINAQPLYCDDDHLSKYGRSLLVPAFQPFLMK